jgi:hypothetical protein
MGYLKLIQNQKIQGGVDIGGGVKLFNGNIQGFG